jgi:hypothetical protein
MPIFSSIALGLGVGAAGAAAAGAIGTGLAIGGTVAGVGSIASGILAKQAADKKQRAYANMTQWAAGQYADMAEAQRDTQNAMMEGFLNSRAQNLDLYSREYDGLINDFNNRFQELENSYAQAAQEIGTRYGTGMEGQIARGDQAIDRYRAGMQQALDQSAQSIADFRTGMQGVRATAAVGRTNTLAAIDQATQSNLSRTQQMQALTGLGGTSFGASSLSAIQSQGAMERGIVEEQYADKLAGIEQAMVSGVTGLEQQRLAQQMGMLQNVSTLEQAQVGRRMSMQEAQTAMDLQRNRELQAMREGRVGGVMNMRADRMRTRFGQREDVARQRIALGSDFLNAQVNLERERVARVLGGKEAQAQYAGSGYQAAAAIVGGATSGIASGIMGMYQPYMQGMMFRQGMNS